MSNGVSDFESESEISSSEELETELYSVLHYNSLSGEIPPELLEKYDIHRNEKNEFLISLKNLRGISKEHPEPQDVNSFKNTCVSESSESKITYVENAPFQKLVQTCANALHDQNNFRNKSDSTLTEKHIKDNDILERNQIIRNTAIPIKSKKRKSKKKRRSTNQTDEVTCTIQTTELTPENNNKNIVSRAPKHFHNVIIPDEESPVTSNSSKDYQPVNFSNDDVILISSSSSDSDVIIHDQVHEITYVSSDCSSIEILSDFEDSNSMLLNTSNKNTSSIFPECRDEEEHVKINWSEVSSPRTWSERMKKYYNRPSKRLKNFDCEKILQEMKGKGTWKINAADLFPVHRHQKRCTLCRQTDHLMKNCPKRFANCSMCGDPGHVDSFCPQRMCLNCGQRNPVFVAMCQQCESNRYKECSECKQIGHIRSNCPDTWRRYHSTIDGPIKTKPDVLNGNLLCCNCGKKGHLYENCTYLYWSRYPPSSFLIQNYKELNAQGNKQQTSNVRHSYERNKKQRWSDPADDLDIRGVLLGHQASNSQQYDVRNTGNFNYQQGSRPNSEYKRKNRRQNKNQRYFNNMSISAPSPEGKNNKKGKKKSKFNKYKRPNKNVSI